MRSSSVVQTLSQPESEEVADVFRIEEVVVKENGICHTKTHGGIISPYAYFTMSSHFYVRKSIFDNS